MDTGCGNPSECPGLEDTIKEGNQASNQNKAKSMIFLRHHLHESLKNWIFDSERSTGSLEQYKRKIWSPEDGHSPKSSLWLDASASTRFQNCAWV